MASQNITGLRQPTSQPTLVTPAVACSRAMKMFMGLDKQNTNKCHHLKKPRLKLQNNSQERYAKERYAQKAQCNAMHLPCAILPKMLPLHSTIPLSCHHCRKAPQSVPSECHHGITQVRCCSTASIIKAIKPNTAIEI